MKFSLAWAEIANQNVLLKTALACVSICAVCFAVVSLKLALKEPLIIERSCFNRLVKSGDARRTNEEIETFVRIALEQRFDSDAKSKSEFLSTVESSQRMQEQKELSSRQLKQRILVNSVVIEGSDITIDADRVITVGAIRSALPFPLKLKVESQERTDGNPYGLIVSSVKSSDKKENK